MKTKGRGFTLIELMVVIAIFALMLGFLMPALEKARDSADTAACMARLRQLGLAMTAYSSDYAEWLPTNSACSPTVVNLFCDKDPLWDDYPEFQGPLPGIRPPDRCHPGEPCTSMYHWCNKLYQYCPVPETYVCEVWESVNGPMHFFGLGRWIGGANCTYGWNHDLGGIGGRIKTSHLTHPGDTVLLGHACTGERDYPCVARWLVDDPYWNTWVHMRTAGDEVFIPESGPWRNPTTYILGRNPFLFGDMHVKSVDWFEHHDNLDSYYSL